MTTLLLSWRNLWRNRRRSALTILSIAFGLAAVMFGQSLLRSFQRQMIDKSTGVMLGHVQVQAVGVRDRKIPRKLLSDPERVKAVLRKDARVLEAGARLLFTGLAHGAGGSRGVLVVGVEPEVEARISILPGYITQGRYIGKSPRDIFLGEKLAGELDVRLGERLVVMGQTPGKQMSSELFRVAGLYHTGSVNYDGQVVYVSIGAARRIRDQPGKASHVVAKLHDPHGIDRLTADRREDLDAAREELLTYRDVGSEIVGIKKFQDALLIVVLVIIYSIVGLGILNTISMSFFERIREFGVVRALGARRKVVFWVLVSEAAWMGLIGALAGLAFGLAVIGFFGVHGLRLPLGKAMTYFIPFDDVIRMRPIWSMHLWSAAGLFLVSLGAALGPAVRATRLLISAALRHV